MDFMDYLLQAAITTSMVIPPILAYRYWEDWNRAKNKEKKHWWNIRNQLQYTGELVDYLWNLTENYDKEDEEDVHQQIMEFAKNNMELLRHYRNSIQEQTMFVKLDDKMEDRLHDIHQRLDRLIRLYRIDDKSPTIRQKVEWKDGRDNLNELITRLSNLEKIIK